MSTITWPAEFEGSLRTHLPLLDPDQPITADLDLAVSGLDSLATVSLLLEVEDRFDVTFPDDKLTATTFQTAGSLWLVIAALVDSC
jgi:D-alanine--poly(phosphoribitol) ligase subunit 2